jgi:hypothetical protein
VSLEEPHAQPSNDFDDNACSNYLQDTNSNIDSDSEFDDGGSEHNSD